MTTFGIGLTNALGEQSMPPDISSITIDANAIQAAFPHYWEACVGSDRAIVALRKQWLDDLEKVRREAGMKSVRFHGLFNDEMGVWPAGYKTPNFLYVDTVFDSLVSMGLKPFVELSFMPGALASGTKTAFSYKGNITPPKDMAQWKGLIQSLVTHCVERYGLKEVASWNFEVWNEPNLTYFWSGTQAEYFELYRQAATAIKAVNPVLRVGGPSTAQAGWVADLLQFCATEHIPIDFASTHIYPDDPQGKVFGPDTHYTYEEVIPQALRKVKAEIAASAFPQTPLYISEWSSQNPAFIANTIKGCAGLAESMSYWTFDNVFEELGVPRKFMNTNFGLLGMGGIPRPSYHAFTLLHKLGDKRVQAGEGPILATRRSDGSLAILLWNLIPAPANRKTGMGDPALQISAPETYEGASRTFLLKFDGPHRPRLGRLSRVDETSGNFRHAYTAIGSPDYPTSEQIAQMREKSAMAPSEKIVVDSKGEVTIAIPPNGLALLELSQS